MRNLGIKYIGIFFASLICGTPAIAQEKAVDNSSGGGAAASDPTSTVNFQDVRYRYFATGRDTGEI